jgi:hypothetical protein
MKTEFRKALCNLINRHSTENGSDTPDFMLAEYLCDCLDNFDRIVRVRDEWYGRNAKLEVPPQCQGPTPPNSTGREWWVSVFPHEDHDVAYRTPPVKLNSTVVHVREVDP